MTGEYTVYEHTFPNGKKYVGITSQKVSLRWRNDGSGYNNQKLIKRAIKKYGWENVSHKILFSGLSQSEARKKEIELIKEMNLMDPMIGYNTTEGGDIPPLITRPVYCIEDDIIYPSIEEASRRTGINSHQIQWACSGKLHTTHKKHWCYNDARRTIEEIESCRKYCGGKKTKVRCVETGVVYESVKEATFAVGGKKDGVIGSVCKGTYKAKTYMGYHWEYAEKEVKNTN